MRKLILGLVCCLACGWLSAAEEVKAAEKLEIRVEYYLHRVLPFGSGTSGFYLFDFLCLVTEWTPKEDATSKPQIFDPTIFLGEKEGCVLEAVRNSPWTFGAPNGTTVIDGVNVKWERYPLIVSEGTTSVTYREEPEPITMSITIESKNRPPDSIGVGIEFKREYATGKIVHGVPLKDKRGINTQIGFDLTSGRFCPHGGFLKSRTESEARADAQK